MIKQILFSSSLAILFLVLASSSVKGQSHDDTTHEEGHEFKRFRAAINLAHAYIPAAEDIGSNYVIIPVWGLDFLFRFNEKWGMALKNDIEIAQYTLPESDASGEVVLRENPLVISLPVYYGPWEGGLTFFAGPGIELEANHNYWIARFGIGYEFEFAGHWDLSPEIVYDLKNGTYNSFTIAIGIGKSF